MTDSPQEEEISHNGTLKVTRVAAFRGLVVEDLSGRNLIMSEDLYESLGAITSRREFINYLLLHSFNHRSGQ